MRDPNKGYILTECVNLMANGTQHVGARNTDYKIVCAGGVEDANCSLYNLEEYPLEKPESCEKYTDNSWTPDNPGWHYCRLIEVVKEDSYVNGYSVK
jgi:hypothetical protein